MNHQELHKKLGDNRLLYITTEVEADHSKIIDGVRNLSLLPQTDAEA
jgi:hypothetical protein